MFHTASMGTFSILGSNLSNRWNFIAANGNVKSQMNKSQSVKMYRRSLQKRLLHHKQKLQDIDHLKKNFMAQEQTSSNALMKQQGKQFWKELTQFASKVGCNIIRLELSVTPVDSWAKCPTKVNAC